MCFSSILHISLQLCTSQENSQVNVVNYLFMYLFSYFSPKDIFPPLIFREGGKGRVRKRNIDVTYIDRLPPASNQVGNQMCNPGTCP